MPDKVYTTPLVQKLGIKEDCRVLLVNAPEDFQDKLTPLPLGVNFSPGPKEKLDVIVLFVSEAAKLQKQFPRLLKRLTASGGFWIAYPKKTSGVSTDITFEVVQSCGLTAGVVDNKVCAIDEIWTALRFVYRKEDRSKIR